MSSENRCLMCNGKLHSWNSNPLQTRFTDGVQKYLCDVHATGANEALRKSREKYGINQKVFNIGMRRFKKKHKISKWGPYTAMQDEMIYKYHQALIWLMLWQDIVAVKKYLNYDTRTKNN